MSEASARRLWRRYLLGLALFAGLAAGTLLAVTPLGQRLDQAERDINLSGRQRMLSQRIALLTLERSTRQDGGAALDKAMAEFSDHNDTLYRSSADSDGGPADRALWALYHRPAGNVFERSKAFAANARRAAVGGDGSSTFAAIVSDDAKGPLLSSLNEATSAFEGRAHAITGRIQRIEWTAGGLAVLLILAEALLIVWPAHRVLTRIMDELAEKIRELEQRDRALSETVRLAEVARQTQAALRESETNFRLLVAGVVDYALYMLDPEGIVSSWNGGAERVKGYRAEEIVGRHFSVFHTEEDQAADAPAEALATAARTGRYVAEALRVRKDGSLFWASVVIDSIRDDRGELLGFAKVTQDITERKNAERAIAESEANYRLLAENASDLVTRMNAQGVFTYVSPSALSITGYAAEEIVGRPAIELVHPDDRTRVEAEFAAAYQGPAGWRLEYRIVRQDGAVIWMEARPTMINDPATGELVAVTDVIRDITARRALEDSLAAARDEAQAATAVKAEFLSNMSHELRTPLTSIQGFGRLAATQPELGSQTRHFIGRILAASDGLISIVNDILDFSKLEAGEVQLDLKPCSPAAITEDIVELLAPQADARGLTRTVVVEPGLPASLLLDSVRVRQVLLNLVGNGVKFTESGGVTVKAAHDGATGRLRFEVSDTGAGIAPENLERLFKRFSQVDGSITRVHGGTGLGLAICKGLVDVMGGAIGVDSALGEGSTFWFEIPAKLAPDPACDGIEVSDVLEGIRVLIVDDQATTRELVRAALSLVGAETAEAADGLEAIEATAKAPYDVILMDLRMPLLDGFAATRAIRGGSGPNVGAAIVAFSAELGSERLGALESFGFDARVAKPLDAADLIKTITGLVFGFDEQPVLRRASL